MKARVLGTAVALSVPCFARADASHGPSAPDSWFPSHHFQLGPHSHDRPELAFHYGLGQPLLLGGFNAALDVRYKRFIFSYSHGQGLDATSVSLSSRERDAGMHLEEPWTTGFGAGITLFDELHLLVDLKMHAFEARTPVDRANYRTVTIGLELGYRLFLWKGLHIAPVLRYWPNIHSTLPQDGVQLRTADGGEVMHASAHQGWNGVVPNVLIGWAFDL